MSKRQTICRNASPEKPYTQICNTLLRDSSLSLDGKGLLVTIISLPVGWEFNITWAREKFKLGEERLERIIKDLRTAGYCRKTRYRRPDGTFSPFMYEFTDVANLFGDGSDSRDSHLVGDQAVVSHPVADTPLYKRNKEIKKTIESTPLPPEGDADASPLQTREQAEGQKPKPKLELVAPSPRETAKAKASIGGAALKLYNEAAEAHSFTKCSTLTPTRQKRLEKRIEEIGGLENFKAALSAIPKDAFLMGRLEAKDGQGKFRLDLDRLLSTGSGLGDVLAKLLDKALDTSATSAAPAVSEAVLRMRAIAGGR